jgi:hypothetical protein
VQQYLRRQDGVAKVDVSLVDGKVAVHPKEDSRFDPSALLKAVFDSGVSVAEMTVVATGELMNDRARGLVFKVSNTVEFEVKPNGLSQKLKDRVGSGKPLKLRGLLYKKTSGKMGRRVAPGLPLEILEVLN